MNGNTIRTFLGANSANGFASLYGTFAEENRMIVIKGGPGSGKSGIMKRIAAEAVERGYFTEYCYCSSDAESLDGIRIPELGLCVADGTSPHLIEPRFPGAKDEIFYTGSFWDGEMLRKSLPEIEQLSGQIGNCFAQAYRYLNAAGKAAEDVRAAMLACTDRGKAERFADNFMRKKLKRTGKESKIRARYLSAIAPQGNIVNRDTLYTLAERVYILNDPWRLAPLVLNRMIETASELGHEIYVFYDPLCPDVPEHIAIPDAGLGIATSNRVHTFEPQNGHRINLKRFCNPDSDAEERSRSGEKLIQACVKEALQTLKKEKAFHDDLEEFYIEAMDFRALNTRIGKYIKTLFPAER